MGQPFWVGQRIIGSLGDGPGVIVRDLEDTDEPYDHRRYDVLFDRDGPSGYRSCRQGKHLRPEVLRQGDAVQCKPNGDCYFPGIAIVMETSEGSACLFAEGWWSEERLVRIGRAKFYPDGTPVEE